MKADKRPLFYVIALLLAGILLASGKAYAAEKKPPLHIKLGPQTAPEEKKKTTDTKTAAQTVVKNNGLQTSSCPLIITGRTGNHYGLRINLIQQDRRALQLATALREDFFRKGRDTQFISALYDASVQTGTSFELLVIKAMMESNLGTLNFNESSTARGAFQYVESTWLNLMHRFGAKAGYPEFAGMIAIDPATMTASINEANAEKKKDILDLRFDPYLAAVMKGLQIEEETKEILKLKDDGFVNITDHYIVHMLGLPLARKFYEMKNATSAQPLASPENPAMKAAADLNRAFFYDKDGNAYTASQSYQQFNKRVTAARKRLYDLLRKYADKRGGCGKFEPIPAYEPEKPAPIAEEARNISIFDLSFFTALLTPGKEEKKEPEPNAPPPEAKRKTPEYLGAHDKQAAETETAAGEDTSKALSEEKEEADQKMPTVEKPLITAPEKNENQAETEKSTPPQSDP